MKSAARFRFCVVFLPGILLILAGSLGLASSTHQSDASPSLGKTKSMAETQHEIVMILIKKKEFDRAASEACKIFSMKWPEDQEPLLLKELLFLADQFYQQGQTQLGLNLIDKNLNSFKKTSSKVAILKEKGYLYKSIGQNDRALDCFREAQKLENKD
jgi:tetratricopeptide (TPR) repeat protein